MDHFGSIATTLWNKVAIGDDAATNHNNGHRIGGHHIGAGWRDVSATPQQRW
jgi:hypothetical protein